MDRLKVFLSYAFKDEKFAARVHYYLGKQPGLICYFFKEDTRLAAWQEILEKELDASSQLILFLGRELGRTQADEATWFKESDRRPLGERTVVVTIPPGGRSCAKVPIEYVRSRRVPLKGWKRAGRKEKVWREEDARDCAREISILLTGRWVPHDGLPIKYPFAYEKDIIDAYVRPNHPKYVEMLKVGCPDRWPDVNEIRTTTIVSDTRKAQGKRGRGNEDPSAYENPIDERVIGGYRSAKARILVDARSAYHDPEGGGVKKCCLVKKSLTFPEAGPREILRVPSRDGGVLTVGILVSGGIAPGINAVISGIVERHVLYADPPPEVLRPKIKHRRRYRLQILGYRNGFAGLLAGDDVTPLGGEGWQEYTRSIANRGGTDIGTSRCDRLLTGGDLEDRDKAIRKVVENLSGKNVDILYVIGGDGSMKAAHAIWTKILEMRQSGEIDREISIVGVPKTMDNDILWVWQAFGFMSAVEHAKEAIRQLHTEAKSNPRLCVVQLFGSDSGFVVSHAALASGVSDAVLIPEVHFKMSKLSDYIKDRLSNRYVPGPGGRSPYGMIVMAETAIPDDVDKCMGNSRIGLELQEKKAIKAFLANDGRVDGQTPDALRTGGLKIVSRVLQQEIRKMKASDVFWESFRVFTNEPRHLIRAISPSASDVIFGQRLGVLAVDNAMAGYADFMISQWMTEYVLVPLKLVVLGRKRVPHDGIFWKSVVANTGQRLAIT